MKDNKKIMFGLFLAISALMFAGLVAAAPDSQKALGDPSAKITMVIYTDFQDPFSARWYADTLPDLQEEYFTDRELRIVFKHFPLSFHQDSMDRAKAAECAAEQGVFFAFAEEFYNDLSSDTDMEYYQDIADGLGVPFNFENFEDCFDDSDTLEIINEDISKGTDTGVSGTPTFFIRDRKIVGSQPFSSFKEVIDSLLDNMPPEGDGPRDMQAEPIRGDGQIQIVGYMGYNDPFSRRSWAVIDKLFEEFGENKIEFQFRNFPLSFQDSNYESAQAGECVLSLSDSDTFFRYSSLVMDGKSISESSRNVGLDFDEIENCVSEKKFYPEVLDDLEKGGDARVRGTPTFFINNIRINGAQAYEFFEETIQDELDENDTNPSEPEEDTSSGDQEDESEETIPQIPSQNEEECNSGCQFNDSCLQFGQRILYQNVDSFCAFSGGFEQQRIEGEMCQNDYECLSNQCSNGKCVDVLRELEENQSLMRKLLEWFDRIFG